MALQQTSASLSHQSDEAAMVEAYLMLDFQATIIRSKCPSKVSIKTKTIMKYHEISTQILVAQCHSSAYSTVSHAAETKDPWRDARPKFMCCSVSVICCGLR